MRVLVCGGRDYGDLVSLKGDRNSTLWSQRMREHHHVMTILNRLAVEIWPKRESDEGDWLPDVTIISGGATGADTAAIDWAVTNWCQFEEYKADWEAHGKAAGPIRNAKMLAEGKPDFVVAFPGGKGTANMVKQARNAEVEVLEIKDENQDQVAD